jgi:hypothetical protein
MEIKDTVKNIESKLSNIRYNLILKTLELDSLKENSERFISLQVEVYELRNEFYELNTKILTIKFPYEIRYEVSFKNIRTNQIEKETYCETIFLNEDIEIMLPNENGNWDLHKKEIKDFLHEVNLLLKNKYDEITLLSIRKKIE